MSGAGRKAHEAHAELQRRRILAAAERCFIEHGFHAASMAGISAAANMSPGLIYRYFENKSAIILAIIQRHLAEACSDIESLQTGSDLIERLCGLFERWRCGDETVMNPVLFLETTAEATRDPQIAAALDESERTRSNSFMVWLRRFAREQGHPLDEEEIARRALVMQCFIEGLAIRAARQPALGRDELRASLETFLPHLLAPRR